MNNKDTQASLIDVTDRCYVIAHREDVTALVTTLGSEGYSCEIVRGPYLDSETRLPAIMRCLVNHRNAWRGVAAATRPALVVEADFVPVRGLAQLPSPLPYVPNDANVGFAWLYSAGSILYGFDRYGYPHGHACTTVAYILTPAAAQCLIRFADREVGVALLDGRYRPWDTYIGIYLRKECGIVNHIPRLSYGEHGGIAQAEHAVEGIRGWHQADRLVGELPFLPLYARGSRLRFALVRARAYARAWARVGLLRYFHPFRVNADSSRSRIGLAVFTVARLILPRRFVVDRLR
jgi:hypothetical protein